MATRRFVDIGANLTDPMFFGIYNGTKKHAADLNQVLSRAFAVGIEKIMVTAGCREDVLAAKTLCASNPCLYYTVGCHPTRCNEFHFSPEQYYQYLITEVAEGGPGVVAIGECGLDYDREHFCPKDVQKTYFRQQLRLASETRLPLFLHCRNAHEDFLCLMKHHVEEYGPVAGVVHTFDGTSEQAADVVNMGLYVGFNGCSLKTSENLTTVASVPSNKIVLESDAPWCEIRPTHAGFHHVTTKFDKKKPNKWVDGSMVAGRNEPANILQVLEVVAGARNQPPDELATIAYANALTVFPGLLKSSN